MVSDAGLSLSLVLLRSFSTGTTAAITVEWSRLDSWSDRYRTLACDRQTD